MNQALPPRDRGHRGGHTRRQPRSGWIVPGAVRLVAGTELAAGGVWGTKKPPERSPGGGKEQDFGRSGFERIGALPILALRRFHTEPHLRAKRAADKAAYRMGLPFRGFHNLLHGGSARALQQLHDLGSLAALPGRRFGSLSAFRRFLGRWGLLARLPLDGRDVGRLCGNRGLPTGFLPCTWGNGWGRYSFFGGRCRHFVISLRGDHRGQDIDHSGSSEMQLKLCRKSLLNGHLRSFLAESGR